MRKYIGVCGNHTDILTLSVRNSVGKKMVRKLKYHEQKLLKKVDFISWKTDSNVREAKILRKYHIQRRDDYTKLE